MNYISTRGDSAAVTASQAIRLGIAPDGGLFVPEKIPVFELNELKSLIGKSYQELASSILARYLTDYQVEELRQMVDAAYLYPDKFANQQVTPIRKLSGNQYLLDLWYGPTCAFKDVALQLLPYMMTRANSLADDEKEIIILVATSGDTGKAALEGFKDVPGTRIVVFFPEQGVSEIQRLQMVTQEGNNTHVISVKGNFDDAQTGVKQIFTDPVLMEELAAKGMAFSSANSINWGRLVPQIVYYFFGYLQLCREQVVAFGDKINVAVPTGNFGNILAAYFAKEMGLPIQKLVCASNSNNVLTDFIKTGTYDRNRSFHTTMSPSMDILISSNLERLLFYLAGKDFSVVKNLMTELKFSGRYQIDKSMADRISAEFYGGFASENETISTIKRVFSETKLVIDTHTAVGVNVYERYRQETGDELPVLIASTASPFKFSPSVLNALGEDLNSKNEFALLESLAKLAGQKIPGSLSELTHKPIRHQTVCQREEMGIIVEKLLGLK